MCDRRITNRGRHSLAELICMSRCSSCSLASPAAVLASGPCIVLAVAAAVSPVHQNRAQRERGGTQPRAPRRMPLRIVVIRS